jgi:hypothetical protein
MREKPAFTSIFFDPSQENVRRAPAQAAESAVAGHQQMRA